MNISQPPRVASSTAHFLKRVRAFCRVNGMDERKLAKEATGDPRKIDRIRAEKATQRSMREIEDFMDRYQAPEQKKAA